MDSLNLLEQIHTGEYIVVDKNHYNEMKKKIKSTDFLLKSTYVSLLDVLNNVNKRTILLEKLNQLISDLEVINE